MESEPLDLTITDKSLPIDLSTKKRKISDFSEPSSVFLVRNRKLFNAESQETSKHFEPSHKHIFPGHYDESLKPTEFSQSLRVNIPMPKVSSNFFSGGRLVKELQYEGKPGLPSPPTESDVPCSDVDDLTSPCLYSPPSSPPNSVGSVSGIHPLLSSPGADTSSTVLDTQADNRYNRYFRHFNVLARELMDECDNPVLQSIASGESSHAKLPRRRRAKGGDNKDSRARNNLAARKSRARRKMKADLLVQATNMYKQESIAILKEIAEMQKKLLEKGFQQPLPYQKEIIGLHLELNNDITGMVL